MALKCERLVAACSALLFLANCTHIQLVASYDEQTDAAATALQRDIATFFVKIQADPAGPDARFIANQDFYKKAAVDLSAMQARAAGLYRNSQTLQMLDLLRENLGYLALLHKRCVESPLNEAQREAVRRNGIDASPACQTQFGATTNIADRGDSRLNIILVRTVRNQIDQQLGTIMSLEMAKKRGE